MAKTKKVKKDEANVQGVDGGANTSKEKKLSKHFKSRANNPPTGEMVMAALKALKNERGVPMASICKYLWDNYGGFGNKIGKERREEIKDFIKMEYNKGNIVMTNTDKHKDADAINDAAPINFNKRFNYVDGLMSKYC